MARSKKIKLDVESDEKVEHNDNDLIQCEILKAFVDKYDNDIIYQVGRTYYFKYKRVKEIMKKSKDFIKIIEK